MRESEIKDRIGDKNCILVKKNRCVCVCLCLIKRVCVCVRERERGGEREKLHSNTGRKGMGISEK